MIDINTKDFGNIGESVAICEFVKLNIPVYIPFGDNERADLIAEFNGKLNKIQVKTAIKTKNGVVEFDLTSSTCHRKKGQRHKYTSEEVDYFFCYSIERDKSYLVPVPDTPTTAISIRYEEPKNGQKQNLHMENDYLFYHMMSELH